MSLKYNPQHTTNIHAAGRLKAVFASVLGEKRENKRYTARVRGERMGGGETSVPRHMFFKRENMPVNSDYACVSTFLSMVV